MNNCTLAGNTAPGGGGAVGSTLNNCTLSGNFANGDGGASSSTLTNCILRGNSGGGAQTLTSGPGDAFYGCTYAGGTSDKGTLFRITTGGSYTKLHDFNGTDGATPSAAMAVGPDGALYGSTYSGGISNNGTLFRLSTGGTFTKLHDFVGTDGGQGKFFRLKSH